MYWIHVPIADNGFDHYAMELTLLKNQAKRRVFTTHRLIPRGTSLGCVGYFDRLYVLAHGSELRPGIMAGSTAAGFVGLAPEALAEMLIANGLQNRRIDLRLWSCWSGSGLDDPAPAGTNWPARDANPHEQAEAGTQPESSALRFASWLRHRGYTRLSVTGYRDAVNITSPLAPDIGNPLLLQGHKSTIGPNGGIRVTEDRKVRYRVRAV